VVNDVGVLTCILGFGVSSLPMKYLSLSLGSCIKLKSIWDGIVQKIEGQLASWKMLYLSKGGSLTLIESTLCNLLNYYLFPFAIPVGISNRIEKLQRDFLWGGVGDEFKFHLLSWSKICSPFCFGGLRVRNLIRLN
jgi:hypothetical protein